MVSDHVRRILLVHYEMSKFIILLLLKLKLSLTLIIRDKCEILHT